MHLIQKLTIKNVDEEPIAFIIIFDNVAPAGMTIGPNLGQTIRNEFDLEEIFHDAGLKVFKSTRIRYLHCKYRPVAMWALY